MPHHEPGSRPRRLAAPLQPRAPAPRLPQPRPAPVGNGRALRQPATLKTRKSRRHLLSNGQTHSEDSHSSGVVAYWRAFTDLAPNAREITDGRRHERTGGAVYSLSNLFNHEVHLQSQGVQSDGEPSTYKDRHNEKRFQGDARKKLRENFRRSSRDSSSRTDRSRISRRC